MDPRDFASLAEFLKGSSGLVLTPDKEYLVETRLKPVVHALGLADVCQLVQRLRQGPPEAMKRAVVEAMTTNETLFFRDAHPFEMIRTFVLPELLERRKARKEIRIWCAAASSGQEPYSVAMMLMEEAARLTGWRVEIVATDIDQSMLARAEKGVYSDFEVQRGLPARYLVKYFTKRPEGDWLLNEGVRKLVRLRQQNLLQPFTHLGPFDLVMCRNVLIYFDVRTKADILGRIGKIIQPDGYLMLGGAETVFGVCDNFSAIPRQRALYALNRDAAVPPRPTSGLSSTRVAA